MEGSASRSAPGKNFRELESSTGIIADAFSGELCWGYNSDAGCTRGKACRYFHAYHPTILQRRLAAKDREIEDLRQFCEIRSDITSNLSGVEKLMRDAKAISLDLVIAMDCTSSMSPWITKAKSSIISIIDNLQLDHPNATDIRVGFVAYRDFCDGPKRLQTHPLTKDVNSVRAFIESLKATGGGDGPEDIPGGLEAALKMPFQSNAKRLILVADSPCHGEKFNDGGDDMKYRSEIEQSPDICGQMRELARRGIDFTFIDIQPSRTAKMVRILQEAFNRVDSGDIKFEVVPLSESHEIACLPSVIQSSASSTISRSMARNAKVPRWSWDQFAISEIAYLLVFHPRKK